MKKQEIKSLMIEVIKEQTDDKFWRLPKDVIGNQVYPLIHEIESFYSTLKNGHDLSIDHLNSIIRRLEKIKSSAREFPIGDARKIPNRYKSGK